MRVGIDAHMVGRRETGNETYVLGLLAGLEAIGFAADTYAFEALPFRLHRQHRSFPEASALRIPITTPILAGRDRLDLWHATYVLPPLLPCRTVVSVHDISFARHPEWFSPGVRTMLSALVPRAIKHASRILALSHHEKQAIVDHYGVAPEKIIVTHLAPRPVFSGPALNLPREPVFLSVGNLDPRKNVGTILRALAVLRSRGSEARLILAGKPGLAGRAMRELAGELGVANAVCFAGYVDDDELRHLYATSTALVHPALYEGFGLTVLEAMAQGTPVIASNRSSIPEVAGDAAILVDPTDVEAWSAAMSVVLEDETLRADLTARGHARAGEFSWERCAHDTVEAYRAALL